MTKGSKADRLAMAIKMNSAHAASVEGRQHRNPADIVRTTLSAPASAVIELRQLALLDRCTMNDLILISIQDFLRSIGRDSAIEVSPAVRERIEARRRQVPSDANQIAPGQTLGHSHK